MNEHRLLGRLIPLMRNLTDVEYKKSTQDSLNQTQNEGSPVYFTVQLNPGTGVYKHNEQGP